REVAPDDVETASLPAHPLAARAGRRCRSGARDARGGGKARPHAGEAQPDRVLEVFDPGEGVPRMKLEQAPAEQHPVPDQVGRHAQAGAAPEADSMEEDEPDARELRRLAAGDVDEAVVRLHRL